MSLFPALEPMSSLGLAKTRAFLLPSVCEVISTVSLSPGSHGRGYPLQKQPVVSVDGGKPFFLHLRTQGPLNSIRFLQTSFSKPHSISPLRCQQQIAGGTSILGPGTRAGRPLHPWVATHWAGAAAARSYSIVCIQVVC